MLIKFAVTNYRGFEKRIELNLSSPAMYEFNKYAIKNGAIKNGIIYGANGSGKSNLALAIFDIVNHLSQKNKQSNYYDNFSTAGKQDIPTTFEYTFKFNNDILEYIYSKNSDGSIAAELLNKNNENIFTLSANDLVVCNEFSLQKNLYSTLTQSANRASIVNFLLASVPLTEDHYLIKLRDFVDSMLWVKGLKRNEFIGLETGGVSIINQIIRNNWKDEFQKFLLSISNQHFDFVVLPKNDNVLFCNINNCLIDFETIISTGTQSLILLFYWLKRLDKASFVFIDEFDAFYHYRLSFNVCKALFEKECQVFLSSHNTYLMSNELLRPDCNFVINNNVIKPLYDCTNKELRVGHNIEKLYRGNAFEL